MPAPWYCPVCGSLCYLAAAHRWRCPRCTPLTKGATMPDLDPTAIAALKAASPEIEPDDADAPAPLPEDDDPAAPDQPITTPQEA